jgi:uncharacterized Ntn-hydrolase superfamily protein
MAYDPATLTVGVAVASRIMAVGADVPHSEHDVLVVSQGLLPNYGADLARLLFDDGHLDVDAMYRVDPLLEERQLAWIDRRGRLGYFAGYKLIPIVSHHSNEEWHVSAQGNMLANTDVTGAMVDSYVSCRQRGVGFTESLLYALYMGEYYGGDRRIYSPVYSAALYTVQLETNEKVDLRIDLSPHPIHELIVLYRVYIARQANRRCRPSNTVTCDEGLGN